MSDRDTFGGGGGSTIPPSIDYPSGSSLITGQGAGPAARSGSQGVGGQTGQGGMGGQGSQGSHGGSAATQAADQAKEKAGQALDTAKQKASQVTDQASAKADQGIDKAATGLDKAADLLRDKTQGMEGQGGAGQTAMNVAGTAASQLDKAARYLEGKDSGQLVADLEAYVRREPTKSLLIAAGVGFLLRRIVR